VSLNANTKAEIFNEQTDIAFFNLIVITHPDITTMRFCDNNETITYLGDDYLPWPFKLIPPKKSDSELSNAKLTISNVDRSIIGTLRGIDTPPLVDFAVVSVTGAGMVTMEAGWFNCKLSNVTYNAETITGDLRFDIWVNDVASLVRYNNLNFPAIYG
jgi:hypothetical protein